MADDSNSVTFTETIDGYPRPPFNSGMLTFLGKLWAHLVCWVVNEWCTPFALEGRVGNLRPLPQSTAWAVCTLWVGNG